MDEATFNRIVLNKDFVLRVANSINDQRGSKPGELVCVQHAIVYFDELIIIVVYLINTEYVVESKLMKVLLCCVRIKFHTRKDVV